MTEANIDKDVNENLPDEAEIFDTDNTDSTVETESEANDEHAEEIDYSEVVIRDVITLRAEFPELSGLSDVCELENPLRYAALRDLGLSPAEAYLATSRRHKKDNRSHLHSTRTASYSSQGSMSEAEMAAAREIFGDISDSEIRKLYKKVTK
jgi:hypothetical protein